MNVNLTISAKKLDPKVNYIPFGDNQVFHQENIKREVLSASFPKKTMMYLSALMVGLSPNIASAEEVEIDTALNITPREVFQKSLDIGLTGVGISFGITTVLLIASATLGQLGGKKRKEYSKQWSTDILKGFVQVLAAIPTVLAIYYLATSLFSQITF